MATLRSFIGSWSVKKWKPADETFRYLLERRRLTIAGDQQLTLTWADGRSRQHQVHFQFDNESPNQISSGPVKIEEFTCVVILTLPTPEVLDSPLQGEILAPVHDGKLGDGPVGTFTAEASGGNEGRDAARQASHAV